MKLSLNKKEMLNVLHSSLCNGGLIELRYCDVELAITEKEYVSAKNRLKKQISEGNNENVYSGHDGPTICLEDVYLEILREGKAINFMDHNDGKKIGFTLNKAIKSLSKEEFASDVLKTVKHEDDAWTGFNIIQGCLYGDVIYG